MDLYQKANTLGQLILSIGMLAFVEVHLRVWIGGDSTVHTYNRTDFKLNIYVWRQDGGRGFTRITNHMLEHTHTQEKFLLLLNLF